jgi:hypothetical protein
MDLTIYQDHQANQWPERSWYPPIKKNFEKKEEKKKKQYLYIRVKRNRITPKFLASSR